jgi:hypothetical protein
MFVCYFGQIFIADHIRLNLIITLISPFPSILRRCHPISCRTLNPSKQFDVSCTTHSLYGTAANQRQKGIGKYRMIDGM